MSADHVEPRENQEMEDCEDAETPISNKKVDLVVLEDRSIKVVKPQNCSEAKEDGVQNSADGHVGEQYEMMLKKEGAGGGIQEEAKGETLDLRCGCRHASSRMGYAVIGVMLLSNVLNYMDRFTIAGVLKEVQEFYNISNASTGLMQATFITSYMFLSLIFGYLGDRFNRKLIITLGIFCWSAVTLASSFVDRDYYSVFLLMRALLGIGQASYSTVAPTIIADLFVDTTRTTALSIFYFAIPVGSGLGYIIGAYMAQLLGGWQWALRVTPIIGLICVILTILLVKEPPRGAADGAAHKLKVTSWGSDLKYLVKNKSFMLSSAGFTCVSFVTGALALWAPLFMYKSILVQPNEANDAEVSLVFGILTCLAGFLGVAVGSLAAGQLRKISPRADPIICGFGLITGGPFLLFSLCLSRYSTSATWVLIFIGETLVSLNWALVTDILMYTVIPTRRSTAEAVQILMCHALGDAGSPYLVGLIADSIILYYGYKDAIIDYTSMQYALFMTCFVCVIGGGFFLGTAIYVAEDRRTADLMIKGVLVNGKTDDVLAKSDAGKPNDLCHSKEANLAEKAE